MQNTKTVNIIIGLLAVLAVVFGVSYLKPPKVEVAVNVPEQKERPYLAAVSTLDGVDSPYVNIAGRRSYVVAVSLSATSSIPAFVRDPFRATTTIESITAHLTRGITGTNTIDISTTSSATCYGSSTPALVKEYSLTSVAQATIHWQPNSATSTNAIVGAAANILPGQNADGTSNYILKPSECVTFRIATGTAGTFGTYLGGLFSVVLSR